MAPCGHGEVACEFAFFLQIPSFSALRPATTPTTEPDHGPVRPPVGDAWVAYRDRLMARTAASYFARAAV